MKRNEIKKLKLSAIVIAVTYVGLAVVGTIISTLIY